MLKEKDYDEISITELCLRSEVPRNTFYRYFADKESVLKYLFDQSMCVLLEKVLDSYYDSRETELVNYIARWLRDYRKNDSLWNVFSESRHNLVFGLLVRFYGRLSDASYKLDFNNQYTKYIIFLAYGMQGILDVWKHSGYEQNEMELAYHICKVLKTPLIEYLGTCERAEAVILEAKTQNYFED